MYSYAIPANRLSIKMMVVVDGMHDGDPFLLYVTNVRKKTRNTRFCLQLWKNRPTFV